MRNRFRYVVPLVLVVLFCGCPTTGMPRLFNPGPEAYQRQVADRFDPYPENDTGPAIVGGRPREYQVPRAETTRARWNPFTWTNNGHVVPQGQPYPPGP